MIGAQLRPVVGKVADPLVNRLHAWGVTPDAVTATGTVGVVAAALAFFPGGHFLVGTLVITLFVLTDTIDGALARKRGVSSSFGAWLDSSCDRVADGAIFGGLLLWYAGRGDDGYSEEGTPGRASTASESTSGTPVDEIDGEGVNQKMPHMNNHGSPPRGDCRGRRRSLTQAAPYNE